MESHLRCSKCRNILMFGTTKCPKCGTQKISREGTSRYRGKSSSGLIFELDVPSSWSMGMDKDGCVVGTPANFTTFRGLEIGSKIAIPNIGVHATDGDGIQFGEQRALFDEFVAFKNSNFTDFIIIKRSDLYTADGDKGKLIFYEYRIGNHLLKTVQGVVIKQRYLCAVHGEHEAEEYSAWEDLFLQIIQSLRLSLP